MSSQIQSELCTDCGTYQYEITKNIGLYKQFKKTRGTG